MPTVTEKVDVSGFRNVNVDVKVNTTDPEPDAPKSKEEKRHFYYQEKGPNPRADGVYLDDEQRREAEGRRALVEGREPDFENPPSVTGTPLVQEGQLDGGYAKRKSDAVLPVNVSVTDSDGTTGDAGRTQPVTRAEARGDSDQKKAKFTTEAGPVVANTAKEKGPQAKSKPKPPGGMPKQEKSSSSNGSDKKSK